MTEQLLDGLPSGVLKSEPQPELADSIQLTDEAVIGIMADRSKKYRAQGSGIPEGIFSEPDQALAAFDSTRAATLAMLSSATDEDLRTRFGQHPAFGMIDANKWFLFVIGHANRHLEQIAQVKTDPEFPAE